MFEEDFCLTCGKDLAGTGKVYCSSGCETLYSTSPSVSSAASSTFSSPHLKSTAAGGQIPALMIPTSLNSRRGKRDRYSVSSSASSTSYSATDDDEESLVDPESATTTQHPPKYLEVSNESTSFSRPGMSFARRPSATNNHSMVPILQRPSLSSQRLYSSSPSGIPYSAPHHSIHDRTLVPAGYARRSSGKADYETHGITRNEEPEFEEDSGEPSSTIKNAKRSRNRASLPSYFSLMKIGSPLSSSIKSEAAPPSSSVHSVSRASPSTPKMACLVPSAAALHHTLESRGRTGAAKNHHLEIEGCSPQTRSCHTDTSLSRQHQRRGSLDVTQDCDGMQRRGRTRERRRESSPLPHPAYLSHLAKPMYPRPDNYDARGADGPPSPTTQRHFRARGRMRTENLDGVGSTVNAPGFGSGRSGLLRRGTGVGTATRPMDTIIAL
jgi:hypothetical protein